MMQTELFTKTRLESEFDFAYGTVLRDRGMKRAVSHANKVTPDWSEIAHSFLVDFVRVHEGEFMAEDVREKSRGIVPPPPHLRAWGSVIRKAAFDGLIRKTGTGTVKNPIAHRANAATWRRV